MSNIIFQVENNDQDNKDLIMLNLSKMIVNRNLYNNQTHLIENFRKNYDNEISFYIEDNFKVAVKFILRRITTIRKVDDIEDFISKYSDFHKFVIVSNLTSKASQQLLEINNLEIFFENDLKVNLIDHVLIPECQVLSEQEKILFETEYNLKKKEMGKILSNDQLARYYGMKPGDILKIIRPSNTSGYSIYYRFCIYERFI
jgi:DNA-directed RNA polymerase I, II, and III subunit RPABC1